MLLPCVCASDHPREAQSRGVVFMSGLVVLMVAHPRPYCKPRKELMRTISEKHLGVAQYRHISTPPWVEGST